MLILYVCIHNAGRSQMAEAITNHLAAKGKSQIRGLSAGTHCGTQINPIAAAIMEEIGISIASQYPKQLTHVLIEQADKIITMGCGVDAESCPARFYLTEDWGLDDPAGKPIEKVRAIRDQIYSRVEEMIISVNSDAKDAK